jgi:hypothetical protein
MSDYHRLDFSFRFLWGDENSNILTLGIYNVYSRKNPFFYYFDTEYSTGFEGKRVLKQISLFPIIPSISYSFKF